MRIVNTVIYLLITFATYGQDLGEIERLYQDGDFENVVKNGSRILETSSNDLVACHLVGRALTELKKFNEAKHYLEKTIVKSAPGWMKSWSLGYLGICNYTTGNLKESKSNFKKAIKLNATKNSTKFSEKMLKLMQLAEYTKDWEVFETENIKFHLQPNHQIVDTKHYCSAREDAFNENNGFFNASLYKKIDFYIWSDSEEGEKFLGQKIGFANPDFCIINAKVNQTKGHEITHILCDFGIKPNKKNQLINEGAAVAFDLTNRNRLELAKSINQDNLSIKDLMNDPFKFPENVVYPIGGALIEYLMEKKDKELIKRLLKEQTYDVLLDVYGIEIIKEFDQKIKN